MSRGVQERWKQETRLATQISRHLATKAYTEQELEEPCKFHLFRSEETGKLVNTHLLKDCRKMLRINGAFAKILAPATAQKPAPQLALPGPPAANPAHIAGAIQYQPRQDAPLAP